MFLNNKKPKRRERNMEQFISKYKYLATVLFVKPTKSLKLDLFIESNLKRLKWL